MFDPFTTDVSQAKTVATDSNRGRRSYLTAYQKVWLVEIMIIFGFTGHLISSAPKGI